MGDIQSGRDRYAAKHPQRGESSATTDSERTSTVRRSVVPRRAAKPLTDAERLASGMAAVEQLDRERAAAKADLS
jgi:hypothetical protein